MASACLKLTSPAWKKRNTNIRAPETMRRIMGVETKALTHEMIGMKVAC